MLTFSLVSRRREDEGGHEAADRMERLFSAPEDNPDIISVIELMYELFLNYLFIIVHFISFMK